MVNRQQPVTPSANFHKTRDGSHATLDVAFRSGGVYRYFAVPARVVDALLTAPSTGAYFHRQIRHRFRYQRLS